MPPELTCITSLQNCGSHSKTGALQCVCVVLCKMSCMMRVLILIFSDRISCHCNANTLLGDECSFCAVCDSWCNLSVYSWAVMKCNFWNEWLSSGSPAQKGSSPHCGCPLTLVSSSPWQKKKKSQHLFNPGSAAGPALVQESRLCLMRLGLCQPRCWEMISKPVALCQGVMDRAGSWRMLVILRHTGWQERWDARILVCKSDLGSSAAGKKKNLRV